MTSQAGRQHIEDKSIADKRELIKAWIRKDHRPTGGVSVYKILLKKGQFSNPHMHLLESLTTPRREPPPHPMSIQLSAFLINSLSN